jgi:hypothetical protein
MQNEGNRQTKLHGSHLLHLSTRETRQRQNEAETQEHEESKFKSGLLECDVMSEIKQSIPTYKQYRLMTFRGSNLGSQVCYSG